MNIHIYFTVLIILFNLGNLYSNIPIDNESLVQMARRYGTPLYVYHEERVRENYHRLSKAFKSRYPQCEVYYAVKANSHPALLHILRDEGAGFDCSCIEEVQLVRQLGVPTEKMICTGAYVSCDDMEKILAHGVQINFDSISVLERFSQGTIPDCVSFRINPGIGMSGCEGLIFAGEDAKFGVSQHLAESAYSKAKQLGAKRFGAHMMTGSNILDPSYFPATSRRSWKRYLILSGPSRKSWASLSIMSI